MEENNKNNINFTGNGSQNTQDSKQKDKAQDNIQKRVLPSRANRGNRMKALENMDLRKEDEAYNYIFAEGSSEDDDFEVSKSNSLNEDSFDSDFYQEESISEFEEGDEENAGKKAKKKVKAGKTEDKAKTKNTQKPKGKLSLGKGKIAKSNKEKEYENEENENSNINLDKGPIPLISNQLANHSLNLDLNEENKSNENNPDNKEKNKQISNLDGIENQNEDNLTNNVVTNIVQDKPKKARLGARGKMSLGKSSLNFLLKEPEPLPNEEAILLGLKRNRRKIVEEDVVDLDMLDIDKIDEIENMEDEEIESSDSKSENENLTENSEEFVPKVSEKKKKQIQPEENVDLSDQEENNDNNLIQSQNLNQHEDLEKSVSEDSSEEFEIGNNKSKKKKKNVTKKIKNAEEKSEEEKVNKFKFKAKTKEKEQKVRYRKNFIDYEEDEDFLKKKKKQKEILYGSKKPAAAKKSKTLQNDENLNDSLIKFETPVDKELYSASHSTAKAAYSGSSNRLINTKTGSQIKLKDELDNKDNVVISDFNVIIKKSFLKKGKENEAEDAFMLDYPNPDIIMSNPDKIIIPKFILQSSNTETLYDYNIKNNIKSNKKANSINLKQKDVSKKQILPASKVKKSEGKQARKISDFNISQSKQNFDSSSEIASYADRKQSYSHLDESKEENKEKLDFEAENEENLNEENYIEAENENENENEDDENYSESDLMKYNDRDFRRKQKKYDADFVTGTQKKAAPKQAPQAPVRLSYQEKLSQKDLLYEAIFTELYNIKSLEDMQRLEELNKRDVNYSSKKQFSEFIKVKRKIIKKEEEDKEANKDNRAIGFEMNNAVIESKMIGTRFSEIEEKKENEILNTHKEEDHLGHNEKVDIDELIRKKMLEKEEEGSEQDNDMETSVTFSNTEFYNRIFNNFNRKPETRKESHLCVITGLPAKYLDPLTKQYYANTEAFKVLRERYFQKEEDALLFRIQTLSDLASQKKEKLKKLVLSNNNTSNRDQIAAKNLISMVNKYGILKNDNAEIEKKVISHRIYNRNRENCLESGMLLTATTRRLVISKRIFRDKHSNKVLAQDYEEKAFGSLGNVLIKN